MKTIRVETANGGIFILKDCTALGMDHIAHTNGIYAIEDGDVLKEI